MAFVYKNRVKETTTTTGTGDITVSGASTGYKTFDSSMSTSDTFHYCIDGGSTGEWEIGLGTYSGSNVFARTTVLDNSLGTTALISFSAGAKTVFTTVPATKYTSLDIGHREILTADRTYYVRTDGSDSNNGLANTAGGAFLTIQAAYNYMCRAIDTAGYNVTIQIADGTYTAGCAFALVWVGGGTVYIKGNVSTPDNVLISGAGFSVSTALPAPLYVQYMKITNNAGSSISNSVGGILYFSNINIAGTGSFTQISVQNGGTVTVAGSYTISSGASHHIYANSGGRFVSNTTNTVTITGTPAWSTAYVFFGGLANVNFSNTTFSGSATGARYSGSLNSVCNTNGGGANYFPGGTAGAVVTGAQYL